MPIIESESDQKYELSDAPERNKVQEELDTPAYLDQLELEEETEQRLSKEIFLEFDAIKKEYDKDGLIPKWKALDNQYEGKLAENLDQIFNLDKKATKIKIGAIIRYLKKAFLKSDPKYSVTAKPEFAEEGGQDVCERQQDYLDFKLDTGGIPFDAPLGKVFKSASLKNGGVLKLPIEIRAEKRKRPETYIGNPIFTIQRLNNETQEPYQVEGIPLADLEKIGLNPESPEVVAVQNEGLESFLRAYPDARKTYPAYVSKLDKGKRIEIMVEYDETVYNDPLPKNVSPENFFVRVATEGYKGLISTQLMVERTNYNWWELKKEEENGKFRNIDELMYQYDGGSTHVGGKKKKRNGDSPLKKAGYENLSFDILECTYYFKIDEEDEEPTKIICYIDEDSEKVIGAINYPYYSVDCIYVPFFILNERSGFWQPGVGEYLTDMHLAENDILNFTLEGAFINNTTTPITKNSEIIDQFVEKSWTHGIPLEADPNELDFLGNKMKQLDTSGLIALMQVITRTNDDVSNVSSLITGKESEIDPTAPASKTMALLRQSGIGIEEFINTILPSFNLVAEIILKLTHQMSEEGRKFRPRPERVVGDNPFSELSREDMVARTNIQSQAYAFNFDKHSEKQEDLALYSTLRQELLIARNPKAVYTLLKNLIKGWSEKWKHQVDDILPKLEDFKKEQLQTATMAVAQYLKQEAIQAQATGQKPVFDPNAVLVAMNEALSRTATPPPDDVLKKEKADREKRENNK